MPHTPQDPLHMTDFAESVLFPIFSQVFFGGDTSWQTDRVLEAAIRALMADTVDEAVTIMLEVLDLDPIALRESLLLSGRYDTDFDFRDTPTNDLDPEETVGGVNEGINDLTQQTDDHLAVILETILQGNIDQASVWERTAAKVVGDILKGQVDLGDVIGDILGGVLAKIDESQGTLGKIFDLVTGRLDLRITNNIIIPSDVFDAVIGGIGDVLDGQAGAFEGIFNTLKDTFLGIFRDVIEREQPELVSIADAIIAQTATEEVADDEMLDEVRLINDGTVEGTGASILASMAEQSRVIAADTEQPTWADIYKAFDPEVYAECDPKPDAPADGKDIFGVWNLPEIYIKAMIEQITDYTEADSIPEMWMDRFFMGLGKIQKVMGVMGALGQRELYEFSRCDPWEIFQVGDAIVAYQRGLISYEQLQTDIRMRGYNPARAEILTEAGYQIPDPASLYAMNLRGLAAGANLTSRFKDLGFNPQDAEAMADLKFYIPGPADLITMAVRDVFSPEIVREYQQDQDFPPDFEYWAKQQGISSDWAHKYWQAHWVLPSIQMAFEMLHRDVINEDQLRGLMRAQDIIPGWRDELIAISYRPFTRVDIRRMHKVGVLDEAGVLRAYKDIGYDQNKAQTLTDFTLKLNADDPDDIEPLDGLTRAAVINAYKDGIIDRPTAEQLLTAEGIGSDAALIYLTTAELDVEAERRKDATETILAEFANGAISLREATREIRALPLTPLEVEKAELKLRRLVAKKTKQPSKSDLSKMFKEGLIGRPTFEESMSRLGYTQFWIDEYVNLVRLGIAPDDEPAA
tara:strand:- start:2379 stop:4790 length:2412 start_codon:yes stop_codon:yes gene_type:complete